MTTSKFSVFDNDRLVFESEGVAPGTVERLFFDGVLTEPRTLDVEERAASLRIVVALREQATVRVTLTYTDRDEVFDVTQGRPLVFETQPTDAGFYLESVTIAPTTTTAHCVLFIHDGVKSARGEKEPLLSLNASTGVTKDEDDVVTQWQDMRLGGATEPFTPLGTGPKYVAQHPTLNNLPALVFSGDEINIWSAIRDERMQYTGPASAFELLSGNADFTICAVMTVVDKGEQMPFLSCLDGASAGSEGFVDSGFRKRFQMADDTGTIQFDGRNNGLELRATSDVENVDGDAVTVVIRYQASSGQVNYWLQGDEYVGTVAAAGTLISTLLTLGGSPDGTRLFRGAIADLRIYDYRWADSERDDYILFGNTEYSVDDTAAPTCDGTAYYLLRGNRGITVVDGYVTEWWDTRDEAPSGKFVLAGVGSGNGPRPLRSSELNNQWVMDFSYDSPDVVDSLVYAGTLSDFDGFTSGGFIDYAMASVTLGLPSVNPSIFMGNYLGNGVDSVSLGVTSPTGEQFVQMYARAAGELAFTTQGSTSMGALAAGCWLGIQADGALRMSVKFQGGVEPIIVDTLANLSVAQPVDQMRIAVYISTGAAARTVDTKFAELRWTKQWWSNGSAWAAYILERYAIV